MNFFVLENDDQTQILQWKTHSKIWIFFVCTIPITILGFFIFMLEFNFLAWIRDMQALMRDMFREGSPPDPENNDPKNSRPSERLRRTHKTFGFSRRATLRSLH
jgi:hypothetical protein